MPAPLYLPQYGPRRGPAYGPANRVNAPSGWDVDLTSNKGVPVDAVQWDALLVAAGVDPNAIPDHIYPCQESSGDLVDVRSGVNLPAMNTPLYQQAVPGWSRVAVGFNDGSAMRFQSSAGHPDISTTPYLVLAYTSLVDDTPASNYTMTVLGATSPASVAIRTTGRYRTISGANQSSDSAASFGLDTVRPMTLYADATNNVTRGGDDQQLLTPVHADASGVRVAIPSTGSAAPSRVLYMAIWTGSNAVTVGQTAALKAVLQTLGWAIPWS